MLIEFQMASQDIGVVRKATHMHLSNMRLRIGNQEKENQRHKRKYERKKLRRVMGEGREEKELKTESKRQAHEKAS